MKKRIIFLTMLLIFSQIVLAGIPRTMSYQGLLTNPDGSIVDDDFYNLNFKMYNVASGGSELWLENHSSVEVTNGIFNVILGSIMIFNTDIIDFSEKYWLGISIDGGIELSPRVGLTSSAYSINSVNAINADSLANNASDFYLGIESINNQYGDENRNVSIEAGDNITVSTSNDTITISGSAGGSSLWTEGTGDDIYRENGNVGIGTSYPINKLDVSGDINTTHKYKIDDLTVLQISQSTGVFVGKNAGANSTSGDNTFLGESTGINNTGIFNTFLGRRCGYNNSGNGNTFIGYFAGISNTSGGSNTFIGESTGLEHSSGGSNTFIGYRSGFNNENGEANVFLGNNAGYNEEGSYKLYIDNTTTSDPLIYGEFNNDRIGINTSSPDRTFKVNGDAGGTTPWYNDSDERLKEKIITIDDPLEKVKKLRGVQFEWKNTKNYPEGKQIGFIAQEVKNIIPEVVDKKGEYYGMQYAPITALLVEAIKELKAENEIQKARVEALEEEITELKKILK